MQRSTISVSATSLICLADTSGYVTMATTRCTEACLKVDLLHCVSSSDAADAGKQGNNYKHVLSSNGDRYGIGVNYDWKRMCLSAIKRPLFAEVIFQ